MGLFNNLSQKVKDRQAEIKLNSQIADNERNYRTKTAQDRTHIAELILDRFEIRWLKNMCRYYDLDEPDDTEYNRKTGNYVKVRVTKQDWMDHCDLFLNIEQIKEYAKSHGIKFADIERDEKEFQEKRLAEYNARKREIEGIKHVEEEEIVLNYSNDFYSEVIRSIEAFRPARNYGLESQYQIELNGFLKSKYPESEVDIEVQVNDSRPDIVIDNQIAIEIKGPTSFNDLETIFGKCHRYQQDFDFMIVALFDVQVDEQKYERWEGGIMQYFPDVRIIRK